MFLCWYVWKGYCISIVKTLSSYVTILETVKQQLLEWKISTNSNVKRMQVFQNILSAFLSLFCSHVLITISVLSFFWQNNNKFDTYKWITAAWIFLGYIARCITLIHLIHLRNMKINTVVLMQHNSCDVHKL